MVSRLKSLSKGQREAQCPICGELILGEGEERHGKCFWTSWHTDFYRSPHRGWQRLPWPEDDDNTRGSGCCG